MKNIVGGVFTSAALIAAAALGGPIDVVGIIKSLGGTAIELANAVCDKPSIEEFLLMS